MIVDDLKKSILDTAIRGDLVLNNPNNSCIEKEIETYTSKYNGLKQEKREKEFQIPSSWRWVKLDNISFSNIGLTYKPTAISNEGVPVFRSNNIKNGKIVYEDLVRVKMQVSNNKMCLPGDILMCSRNGSKKLVGKCAVIDKDGYSFGAFMAIIRSDINDYLYYVFNSNYFKTKMLGDAATTTINQITQKMLSNFWFPLPPLEEQKRIVEKLKFVFQKLDELIPIENEIYDLKNNFSKRIKESILFNYILGLKESNNIPLNEYHTIRLPENWKWEKFSNLTNCKMGKTILSRDLKKSGIPVYSATNTDVIFGFVSKSDLILRKGDIVIPARGNSIGWATIIEEEQATCTQTTIACFPNEKINSKFLYYCCYAFKNVWFKYTGSAIPQVTISNINNNYVPLPPLEEQQKIVNEIEKILPLCQEISILVKE